MDYKISDLEKVVEDLGLKMDVSNSSPNVIAQIWWPHRNSGIIIDGKIYDNQTLTFDDVVNNHKVFKKLAEFLIFDADLQIDNYHQVEFNFILSVNVILRNDRNRLLDSKEKKTDWNLDKTNETIVKPQKIDMTAGYKPYDMFVTSLKKHEKEKVLDGIIDLLSYHNEYGRRFILSNLAQYSGFTTPLELALDNHMIDVTFMIEQTLEEDWPYYQNQPQAKKLFSLLSEYTTTTDINFENGGREYLPDVVVESPKMTKAVATHWSFTESVGARVLAIMIQDEHFKSVKVYLENQTPFDTASWFYGIVDPYLTTFHNEKQVKFFLDTWVDLNNCYDDFIDDLSTLVVRMEPKNLRYAIEKLLGQNPQHLFSHLVDAFKESNAYSVLETAKVLELFVDNPNVDLTYGNAYIIKVFNDDEKMKEKLLEVPGMVDAVVANGDTSLLPNSVQDIFVF